MGQEASSGSDEEGGVGDEECKDDEKLGNISHNLEQEKLMLMLMLMIGRK